MTSAIEIVTELGKRTKDFKYKALSLAIALGEFAGNCVDQLIVIFRQQENNKTRNDEPSLEQ